jgi:uncharacterized protein
LGDKTTGSPLGRLHQLQEVLLESRAKQVLRERTPDHLVHVEAAFQETLRRRQELEGQVTQADGRKATLDAEVASLNEKLKTYQQQLQAVKTNREYGALLNEIDTIKREVRTREDELLALDEAIQAAQDEVSGQDATFPAERAEYEEQMAGWRAEQARLTDEIARANRPAEELRKGIDRRILVVFDRIAKMRSGIAVARVAMVGAQTAACSACNVRLRPQLLSDLRLSRETIYCESCKRMLYWDPRAE